MLSVLFTALLEGSLNKLCFKCNNFMFLRCGFWYTSVVKKSWRVIFFFTSWAYLVRSGLSLTFQRAAHSLIISKSLAMWLFHSMFFNYNQQKTELLSSNDVTSVDNPSSKLIMGVGKSNRPKIETLTTPELIEAHEKLWPFNRTLFFPILLKIM